jgi:hypothetical protein
MNNKIILLLIVTIIFILFYNNCYEYYELGYDNNNININDNINYINYNINNNINYNNIELVISRYNEDLEWLKNEPFNDIPIIIYNKGINNDYINLPNIIKIEKLPNVGREIHTYLYHIIRNYDNLADMTIFLPGSADLQHKYGRSHDLVKRVKETMNTSFSGSIEENFVDSNYNFQIDNYLSSHSNNSNINKETGMKLSDVRPYGEWFKNTFRNNQKNICITWNSIIGISKKNILQNPKSFYVNLIKQIDDHQNPETVHYFERSWHAVFYPYDNDVYIGW